MILLRSFEHFTDCRLALRDFGELIPYEGPEIGVCGKFSHDCEGKIFALYKSEGELLLHTPHGEVHLKDCIGVAELQPCQSGRVILRKGLSSLIFDYLPRIDRRRDADDLTPFIDDEDLSFPIWVESVILNNDKREILLNEWKDSGKLGLL